MVLYLAWWWVNEPKHVAEFLIFNIDYQCMLWYARTECTSSMVLYLAWWWVNEPKHVAEFLIFNIDYQFMLCHWRNKFTALSQNTTGWLLSKWWVACKPPDTTHFTHPIRTRSLRITQDRYMFLYALHTEYKRLRDHTCSGSLSPYVIITTL